MEYYCYNQMKEPNLSFLMRYQQLREKQTRGRYVIAKREKNARHQFPRRPVQHGLQSVRGLEVAAGERGRDELGLDGHGEDDAEDGALGHGEDEDEEDADDDDLGLHVRALEDELELMEIDMNL
jgi:hypothetical protein